MQARGRASSREAQVSIFETLPTIDGYEVIAADTGRQVAFRETLSSANGVAFALNQAASIPSIPSNPYSPSGPKSPNVARALSGAFKRVGGARNTGYVRVYDTEGDEGIDGASWDRRRT